MWIMLTDGFVSIVEHQEYDRYLLVRARQKEHLTSFLLDADYDVQEDAGSDYRYRAKVHRSWVSYVMQKHVENLHYDNFKAATAKKDPELADAYHLIWDVMYRFQEKLRQLHKYGYARQKAPEAR